MGETSPCGCGQTTTRKAFVGKSAAALSVLFAGVVGFPGVSKAMVPDDGGTSYGRCENVVWEIQGCWMEYPDCRPAMVCVWEVIDAETRDYCRTEVTYWFNEFPEEG